MLELYHWEPNGSWLKPLIALAEKQLQFRGHYVDVLSLQQYSSGFPDASPETAIPLEGEGPILVHDGRQISESLFIMEYLEEAFPDTPLRPAAALLQAQVLAWARFINEVFMPAASTLGCRTYLVPQLAGRDRSQLARLLEQIPVAYVRAGWRSAFENSYPDELIEDSRRKISLAVRRLEQALARSAWLVGDAYSLADIDAFSICNSLPTLTPDLVNAMASPQLWQWLERIRSRPAVQTALGLSRSGQPARAFAPGPEHSRWG